MLSYSILLRITSTITVYTPPQTVGRPGSDDCLPKVYLFCYTYPFPRSDTLLMTNYLSVHEDNAK